MINSWPGSHCLLVADGLFSGAHAGPFGPCLRIQPGSGRWCCGRGGGCAGLFTSACWRHSSGLAGAERGELDCPAAKEGVHAAGHWPAPDGGGVAVVVERVSAGAVALTYFGWPFE